MHGSQVAGIPLRSLDLWYVRCEYRAREQNVRLFCGPFLSGLSLPSAETAPSLRTATPTNPQYLEIKASCRVAQDCTQQFNPINNKSESAGNGGSLCGLSFLLAQAASPERSANARRRARAV
jgi:hypothetical protein